jgi:hypothetical protein
MTEAEWLTSTRPPVMWQAVNESFRTDWPHAGRTARKRVLFGAACCRLVWPLIEADERCRRYVEYLERQFDEDAALPNSDVEELVGDVRDAASYPDDGNPLEQSVAANLVYDATQPAMVIGYLLGSLQGWGDPGLRARQIADVMRDIVGNPFRPTAFDPAWRTSTVAALAEGMYTDRAFDRLPILADALEDAGCDAAELLAHLRGDGSHARGCWALDLVLEKL